MKLLNDLNFTFFIYRLVLFVRG